MCTGCLVFARLRCIRDEQSRLSHGHLLVFFESGPIDSCLLKQRLYAEEGLFSMADNTILLSGVTDSCTMIELKNGVSGILSMVVGEGFRSIR